MRFRKIHARFLIIGLVTWTDKETREVMATTTPRVTAFWSAFLNVLIKCIAALGFATPACMKAAERHRTVGSATVPAQVPAPVVRRPAAPVGGYAPPPMQAGRVLVPAPRPSDRGRSLPPTMKQRISAEAHGTSPNSRSIAVRLDGFGHGAAATAVSEAADRDDADRTARRRDRALC